MHLIVCSAPGTMTSTVGLVGLAVMGQVRSHSRLPPLDSIPPPADWVTRWHHAPAPEPMLALRAEFGAQCGREGFPDLSVQPDVLEDRGSSGPGAEVWCVLQLYSTGRCHALAWHGLRTNVRSAQDWATNCTATSICRTSSHHWRSPGVDRSASQVPFETVLDLHRW